MMKAWHFTADKLRDGRPLPKVGEKLVHEDELILCKSGLHGSRSIFDALQYAPGYLCHRTENGGAVIRCSDKFVCSERTILWTVDTTDILPKFARLCALDVIDMWAAPDVVVEFLKTGNPEIGHTALEAAEKAAWKAEAAPWNASPTAPTAPTARAALASWDAARAALASWGAARASWDASWSARAATRAAAWAAAWAAEDADLNLRNKQERRLRRMIYEARR